MKHHPSSLAAILLCCSVSVYSQTQESNLLSRLNKDIAEQQFAADTNLIKSKFDHDPIMRAAYLKGYIVGYQWGLEKRRTSFPFHDEESNLIPPMMEGFFAGQFDGFKGNKPN